MTDDELLAARAEIFGSIFVVVQHLARRADAELAVLGLTTRQWLLLAVLTKWFPGHSPSLSEAAERYGSSRQNVKQIALGLEARGFVRLVPDRDDGRTTRIELTERVGVFDEPEMVGAGLGDAGGRLRRAVGRRDAGPARPRPPVARRRHGPQVVRGRSNMLRIAAAAVVAAHGLIHLIGFVVPWGIATVEGFAYRTTALDGAIALGDAGARALGLVWLACAVGFVVAGLGIWRRASWALPLTAGLAVVSIVVCVLGLPETSAGIVVNAAILGAVAWVVARPPAGPGGRPMTPPVGDGPGAGRALTRAARSRRATTGSSRPSSRPSRSARRRRRSPPGTSPRCRRPSGATSSAPARSAGRARRTCGSSSTRTCTAGRAGADAGDLDPVHVLRPTRPPLPHEGADVRAAGPGPARLPAGAGDVHRPGGVAA